ncbi:MAG: DoxX family protein [Candidatus Binatia bacterium]
MGLNLGEKTSLWPLVILRVWIGSYMFYRGSLKFLRDFPHSDWITRQIGELDKLDLYPWYKSFLMDVVVPNRELIGYLVTYGEILLGLCLIVGLFTRLCSAIGIFQFANYILGPGMARGGATLGNSETFFIAMIVFLFTNPGRTLGLDGLMFKKK